MKQATFEFFATCVARYVRPAVMSYNPFRADRKGLVVGAFGADLFSGAWAHNPGHSGASGLSKWLEFHAPLSANFNLISQ